MQARQSDLRSQSWFLPPRKVLNKLSFSVPADVMRKIAQCAPGVVELVLIPLRQCLEEQQRRRKQGTSSLQVPPHSSFLHCSGGGSQAAERSASAISMGEGCLAKGSLAGVGCSLGVGSLSSQQTLGVLSGAGSPG